MAKQLLLGVCGKKQSGKSSLCNYLQAKQFALSSTQSPHFEQDAEGKVWFLGSHDERLDFTHNYFQSKVYNFADALKKFAGDVLDLSPGQLYGTDKEKNAPTRFLWDNMPDEIRFAYSNKEECIERWSQPFEHGPVENNTQIIKVPRIGAMSAREVMQVFGTDIARKMFADDVWVKATIKAILKDNLPFAMIADVRFESEVNSILDNGGSIIRLTRKISNDTHPSETALDNYDFNKLGGRCLIIDNDEFTMDQKNAAAWGFVTSKLNVTKA